MGREVASSVVPLACSGTLMSRTSASDGCQFSTDKAPKGLNVRAMCGGAFERGRSRKSGQCSSSRNLEIKYYAGIKVTANRVVRIAAGGAEQTKRRLGTKHVVGPDALCSPQKL